MLDHNIILDINKQSDLWRADLRFLVCKVSKNFISLTFKKFQKAGS